MAKFKCPYGCSASFARERDLHRRHIVKFHPDTVVSQLGPVTTGNEIVALQSAYENDKAHDISSQAAMTNVVQESPQGSDAESVQVELFEKLAESEPEQSSGDASSTMSSFSFAKEMANRVGAVYTDQSTLSKRELQCQLVTKTEILERVLLEWFILKDKLRDEQLRRKLEASIHK